jgi:hypothetical protein
MAFYLGRVLAAEIMLGLALQRGSLQHMLEWIDMALSCCADGDRDIVVSKRVLLASVATMRRVSVDVVESHWEVNGNEKLDIYSIAIFFMNEV